MKSVTLIMKVAAVLAIVAVLGILFVYSKRQTATLETPTRTLIPDVGPVSARPPAPSMEFHLDDGSTLALSSLKGKVTHLVFWAEWCEPCRREVSLLQKMADQMGPNYQIVLINLDEDEQDRARARVFLKDQGVHLKATYQDAKKWTELMHVEALPFHSIIDRAGRIATDFIASVDDQKLAYEKLIENLLKEPENN
jgi:thiol-disulfide isomerase/thioredoxin